MLLRPLASSTSRLPSLLRSTWQSSPTSPSLLLTRPKSTDPVALALSRIPEDARALSLPMPVSGLKQGLITVPERNLLIKLYKQLLPNSVPSWLLTRSGKMHCVQCTMSIDIVTFFRVLGMPDTFYSWYQVALLHVWMTSARLNAQNTEEGAEVRYALIEALWKDCHKRIRRVARLTGRRKMQTMRRLSNELPAAFMIYDCGLLGSDMELANAVWRCFFLTTPNPNMEHIEILVSYIRRSMSELDRSDLNSFLFSLPPRWPPLVEKKELAPMADKFTSHMG